MVPSSVTAEARQPSIRVTIEKERKVMAKGLVYILTNPCLDGWVKIGMTERNDIERRLRELNTPTNIPLSYRCYAVYEVENPAEVEKHIHNLIDLVDQTLHARELLDNGRIREREFFKMSPEAAYSIFKEVAALRGDSDKLKPYVPSLAQSQEGEIAERRTKRSNNSFKLLKIPVGDQIAFLYNDTILATVINDKNQVRYEGEQYSVTGLALKLLVENHNWNENSNVNGWRFFTKNGTTLSDLRDAIENAEEDE